MPGIRTFKMIFKTGIRNTQTKAHLFDVGKTYKIKVIRSKDGVIDCLSSPTGFVTYYNQYEFATDWDIINRRLLFEKTGFVI